MMKILKRLLKKPTKAEIKFRFPLVLAELDSLIVVVKIDTENRISCEHVPCRYSEDDINKTLKKYLDEIVGD